MQAPAGPDPARRGAAESQASTLPDPGRPQNLRGATQDGEQRDHLGQIGAFRTLASDCRAGVLEPDVELEDLAMLFDGEAVGHAGDVVADDARLARLVQAG